MFMTWLWLLDGEKGSNTSSAELKPDISQFDQLNKLIHWLVTYITISKLPTHCAALNARSSPEERKLNLRNNYLRRSSAPSDGKQCDRSGNRHHSSSKILIWAFLLKNRAAAGAAEAERIGLLTRERMAEAASLQRERLKTPSSLTVCELGYTCREVTRDDQ